MGDVLKNLTLGLDALFTRWVSNSAHGPLTMFLNDLSRAGIHPVLLRHRVGLKSNFSKR